MQKGKRRVPRRTGDGFLSTKGPTARRARIEEMKLGGVGFCLFDDNWTEFKRLIDKVDKAYQELA